MKKQSGKLNVSSLKQHHRSGKTLTPPLRKIGNLSLSSWYNQRLPNILWAALLISSLEREQGLMLFRSVAKAAEGVGHPTVDGIDHSALAQLSADNFDELFAGVLADETAVKALSPLLFFKHLPDRHHWKRHLHDIAEEESKARVARAVAETFDHQSQASTDCRWLRVLILIVTGRMTFPSSMAEKLHEILDYPNRGDQTSVRPSIRASEISLDDMKDAKDAWPEQFWSECWARTDCIVATKNRPRGGEILEDGVDVLGLYADVGEHSQTVATGTHIDPRYDAVFGLVLNALLISAPVLKFGGHARAEGRFALRVLVESYIALSFLLKKDDPTIWQKYRSYGHGQSKLTYLKLNDLQDDDLPSYISKDDLEKFVNEDIWQEYTEIDLGNWAGMDLRRMSEFSGVKDIYDKYFGWPSIYIHAQWPAVREAVFEQCFNPLHRFHRIPSRPNFHLNSVAPDMVKLVNLHLDRLNQAFPSFKPRIRLVPENIATSGIPRGDEA